ncbi:M23 family metallopeptidase [Saccharothrix lopnurensis]|uniref:M23 family metallopeptidase n=1 Tax=Saccharothrix lopnurensis TaxID=1670621 RepID=A0ABW1P1S2_9PSEU
MTPPPRTPLVLTLTVLFVLVPAHPDARARATRFGWPLAPPHEVVRAFEAPPGPYAAGHRGVDLRAAPGTAVLAAADGVVVHAGPVADRPLVSLAHVGGLRTTYEPVEPSVVRGALVRRGERIGTLRAGHRDCPAEACLHWGALRVEPPRPREHLNPLRLLTSPRIRLLPALPTNPAPAAPTPANPTPADPTQPA